MPLHLCQLDSFPVEIIHLIFDYLAAVDIVRGFLNQSPYIDSIVLNYNFYNINFRSISKRDFDLICHFIHPQKMISLILSDGIDTPNQSHLFFSLFQLEQFYSSLRCLVLHEINEQSMALIVDHLDRFHRLSSLAVINSSFVPLISSQGVFARLKQLNISCQWLFHSITPMNELEYLIITNRCTFSQLRSILSHAPNLRSLEICLERESGGTLPCVTSNVTRLVMNMSGKLRI
jgi:hypothetical protein